MAFIELRNVSKHINSTMLLDKVNLSMNLNEFICIIGKSGAGKTSLLNIIGLIDNSYEGEVCVNNEVINKRKRDKFRKSFFSFVFQDYGLIPYLLPSENIEQYLNKENDNFYNKLLEEFKIKDKIKNNITTLSGGEKQRIGIVKALVKPNKVLLADEPTGSLDSNNSETIMSFLKSQNEGKLIIVATHNIELAQKYATRIITIDDGKIISDEKRENVKEIDCAEYIPENKKISYLIKAKQTYKFLRKQKGTIIPMVVLISLCLSFLILLMGVKSGLNTFVSNVQNEIKDARYIEIESSNTEMFDNLLKKYQIQYKEYYNYDFLINNLLKKQITDINHINFDYSIKIIDTKYDKNIEISCNQMFMNLYNNDNIKFDLNYPLFDSIIVFSETKNFDIIFNETKILNIPKLYISDSFASQIITEEIKQSLSSQNFINLPRKLFIMSPLDTFYIMCKNEPQISFLRRNSVESSYFLINSTSYVYYIPFNDLIQSISYIMIMLICITLLIIFSLFTFLLKSFYAKRKREYALYFAFGESFLEIEKRVAFQNFLILALAFLISIAFSIIISYLINPFVSKALLMSDSFKIVEIETKGIIGSLFCCLIMLICSSVLQKGEKHNDLKEVLKNE